MTNEHAQPSDIDSAYRKYWLGMQILLEGARARTGQTPKEVIWSKNKARLYRYAPAAEKRFPVPILLVYALINRPYILDLLPGSSLVEYLVGQGFDVYLLDWGTPGDEDSNLAFEHYLLDYLTRAIKKMLKASQAQQFTLFGYCMGGTMSAMYSALFPGPPLRNLVLLASPLDFSREDTGLYGLWTSARYFDPHRLAEVFGNIPAEFIDTGSRMVKPVGNYVSPYVTMWELIVRDKPLESWQAMNKWVNDGIPFPGAAFGQWIGDFYQQNKLVKGEIQLRGRRVDLARITCPIFVIAGSQDHICALPQAEAAMRLVSSQDKEFFALNAGHIGLLIGSGARASMWPKLRNWLEARSAGR
jgi:polyhydroxyalkanoate synthase